MSVEKYKELEVVAQGVAKEFCDLLEKKIGDGMSVGEFKTLTMLVPSIIACSAFMSVMTQEGETAAADWFHIFMKDLALRVHQESGAKVRMEFRSNWL